MLTLKLSLQLHAFLIQMWFAILRTHSMSPQACAHSRVVGRAGPNVEKVLFFLTLIYLFHHVVSSNEAFLVSLPHHDADHIVRMLHLCFH